MPHVVCEPCRDCKYSDCVEVCPVECFYEGEQMLYIHAEECIDWVLNWQINCAAMKNLCEKTVGPLVESCLKVGSHKHECKSLEVVSDTHWSFKKCS